MITLLLAPGALAEEFLAGYAQRDVTPEKPTPMWGYGARPDMLSQGTRDPLYAKAVVLEAGGARVAFVGLDLGRGPTERMMGEIEAAVRACAGIEYLFISGSHTHHGPVIELLDEPGMGQGTFDDAVAYANALPGLISAAICEAAENLEPARLGWAVRETDLNRNRHTQRRPKPRDPELAVLRVDKADGSPLAVMVNFAAHPTILNLMDRRFSAEWPGKMNNVVAEALGAPCLFLQGAAGDLSPNTNEQRRGVDGFGAAIGAVVAEMAQGIETAVPEAPGIRAVERTFDYETRIDFKEPLIIATFRTFFFKELLAMAVEFDDNRINPRMTVMVLNEELGLVSGSGEFFSAHATQLKAESPTPETLFIGYANGHHMYFPTLPAVDEGGYGADPAVSWVPPGAGEEMMAWALAQLEALAAAPAQ